MTVEFREDIKVRNTTTPKHNPEFVSFAQALKSARIKMNLSQKEAAKKLEIPQGTLSNWETTETFPKAESLIELLSFYDLEMIVKPRGEDDTAGLFEHREVPTWLRSFIHLMLDEIAGEKISPEMLEILVDKAKKYDDIKGLLK